MSQRAVASELASGTLVEIEVNGVRPERESHAVWIGERPSLLASEFIAHGAGEERHTLRRS